MAPRSRDPDGPSFAASFAPSGDQRAQGRPGAGGTRRSVRYRMHTVWTTGVPKRPAFPARMVLTVSFVLSPGSDALLPPSPCGWLMRGPGRATTSPQDLRHRLRASGSHDFSVCGRSRLIVRGWRVLTPDDRQDRCNRAVSCRACDKLTVSRPASHLAPTLPRPPQPGPHLVTIAKRPFDGPR